MNKSRELIFKANRDRQEVSKGDKQLGIIEDKKMKSCLRD